MAASKVNEWLVDRNLKILNASEIISGDNHALEFKRFEHWMNGRGSDLTSYNELRIVQKNCL